MDTPYPNFFDLSHPLLCLLSTEAGSPHRGPQTTRELRAPLPPAFSSSPPRDNFESRPVDYPESANSAEAALQRFQTCGLPAIAPGSPIRGEAADEQSPKRQTLTTQTGIDKQATRAVANDEKKSGVKTKKAVPRISIKTKSNVDVLDDGFKWRKYGQKAVKNCRHPRGYYRCTEGNCTIKKRVQRSEADPNYVITTYEGMHNHPVFPVICSTEYLIPTPCSSKYLD